MNDDGGPAGLHHDFGGAIAFWIGAAMVQMLLGLCLWHVGGRSETPRP